MKRNHTVGHHVFMETLKFSKFFGDAIIAQEIQNSNNFSGFCSPEVDNFMTQLAIFL